MTACYGFLRARWSRALLGLSLGLGSGCASKPMVVPDGLAARAEAYPVHGRVRTFRRAVQFGPYASRKVELAAQPDASSQLAQKGARRRGEVQQASSFELVAPHAKVVTTECNLTRPWRHDKPKGLVLDKTGWHMDDGRGDPRRALFQCTMRPEVGAPFGLSLPGGATGQVTGRDLKLAVDPVREPGNSDFWRNLEAIGYVVSDDSGPLAAVDLAGDAKVTLRRDLTPERKDALAAVCMALLLLRDMNP